MALLRQEAWALVAALAPIVFVYASTAVGLASFSPLSSLMLAAREPGILRPAATSPLYYTYRVNGSLVVILEGPDLGSVGNSLLVAVSAALAATFVGFFSTALAYLYSAARMAWLIGVGAGMLGFPFVEAYVVERLLSLDYGVPGLLLAAGAPVVPVARGLVGVALYEAVVLAPYAAALIGSYMYGVPREEVEAAVGLGARGWRLIKLLYSLSKPAVVASMLFGTVLVLDDVSGPLVFSRDPLARSLLAYRAYMYFVSVATGTISAQGVGYSMLLLLSAAPFIAASIVWYRRLGGGLMARRGVKPIWRGGAAAAAVVMLMLAPSAAVKLLCVAYAFSSEWLRSLLPVPGLGAWHRLAAMSDAVRAALNSSAYAALVTLSALALITPAAWISRHRGGRLASIVDAAFTLPVLVPGIVVAYGLYLLYAGRGGPLDPLQNPVPLLLVGYYARRSPLYYHAALAASRAIPSSLYEAAVNLGARPLRAVVAAVFPAMAERLVPPAAYLALSVAGEVSLSVTLGGLGGAEGFSHPAPLMYVVASYMGLSGLKYAAPMAAATLLSYAAAVAASLAALRLYLVVARKGYS